MAITSRFAVQRFIPVLAIALAIGPLSAIAVGQAAPDAAERPPTAEGPDEEAAPVVRQSPYAFIALDPTAGRLRRTTIPDMLKDRLQVDERFEKYFVGHLFAQMTRPKTFSELVETRNQLDKHFQDGARHTEPTSELNKLTFNVMYGICLGPAQAELPGGRKVEVIKYGKYFLNLTDRTRLVRSQIAAFHRPKRDFHPAVKYNAMLIVGNLNDTQRKGRRPAVPMRRVFEPLLDVAEQSNRKWPDYLRVAALIGVKRHSQLTQLTAPGKDRIAGSMWKILGEPRPADRSADGDVWIRRLAVEVFGILETAGKENSVTNKLSELVAEEAAGLSLRTAAANAMGKIQMDVAPDGGTKAVATNLGNLAVALCHRELGQGESPSKKRLLTGLSAVQLALAGAPATTEGETARKPTGLAPVAEGEDAIFVKQLHASVGQIVSSVANPDTGDGNLGAAIKRSIKQLETTVQGEPAGADPRPARPNPQIAPF